MASTLTSRNASISLQALSLGAADYITKPTLKMGTEVEDFYRELVAKIFALTGHHHIPAPSSALPVDHAHDLPAKNGIKPEEKKPVRAPEPQAPPRPPVSTKPVPTLAPGALLNPSGIAALAIASSTGGPQALTSLFMQIKGHIKNVPIFITQHMPPTFTTILAEQLAKSGERVCHEPKNGEVVEPGVAYLAPGDFHMVVAKNPDGHVVLKLNQDPQENFCRPSADPMLRSLSHIYGARLAVTVLTGMGQDGMEGAKDVVNNGGSVIAQNEATCIVYGMPKAVVDKELCKAVLPLTEIGAFLVRHIDGNGK